VEKRRVAMRGFAQRRVVDAVNASRSASKQQFLRARQSAFTLVELLVVIAIIGILIALLLPAINAARESARRTKCLNNMRQTALAFQTHNEANKRFPIGSYDYIEGSLASGTIGRLPKNDLDNRRCWMHDTMPYFEDRSLFDMYAKYMKTASAQSIYFPQSGTIVPMLMCPSDPTSPKTKTYNPGGAPGGNQGFSGNMVACAGNGFFNPGGHPNGHINSTKLNGVFFAGSRVKPKDISDGLSKTAFVSEIILSPDILSNDIRGRYYNAWHGGVFFSTIEPPNTKTKDAITWTKLINAVPEAPVDENSTNYFLAARSLHLSGGANVAFADSSARFMTNEVSPIVYKALGSRNGKEVIPDNF
jgi:prepilin-type N-terminal cleavage/methylation domain-containing protein/prepilin-type processing-associated H-X9-DG protein